MWCVCGVCVCVCGGGCMCVHARMSECVQYVCVVTSKHTHTTYTTYHIYHTHTHTHTHTQHCRQRPSTKQSMLSTSRAVLLVATSLAKTMSPVQSSGVCWQPPTAPALTPPLSKPVPWLPRPEPTSSESLCFLLGLQLRCPMGGTKGGPSLLP